MEPDYRAGSRLQGDRVLVADAANALELGLLRFLQVFVLGNRQKVAAGNNRECAIRSQPLLRMGVDRDTYVIFFSDHGDMMTSHCSSGSRPP